MPTVYTDPTINYSDAAFTALEKEHIRKIIGLTTLSELDTPISELTAEQRKVTRYEIDLWFNEIGEGTVKLAGGSDGVDYSQPRDRKSMDSTYVADRFSYPRSLEVYVASYAETPCASWLSGDSSQLVVLHRLLRALNHPPAIDVDSFNFKDRTSNYPLHSPTPVESL